MKQAAISCLIASIVFIFAFEPAPAQPLEGRLSSISSGKSIKFAYRTDAKPFSFSNAFNAPDGYTVDLCKLIARSIEKQLGGSPLKLEWVPVNTENRFDMVASGKADMECGASTVTLSRMKQVDFSSFVFVENTGLVVKRAANIKRFSDLAGKKIAVIGGTSNQRAVATKNDQLKLNMTIVHAKDREEGIAALEDGKVDAFASDKLLLVGAQFANADAVIMLPDDVSIEPYAIVLPRGDWALRLAVNAALAQIYGSGEAMAVFNKWFAPAGFRPSLLMGAVYVLGNIPE